MMNKKELELYVHIPFCVRKCAYCDFLSFPGSAQAEEAYAEQLIKEIRCQGACFQEYEVVTVFIGGGTPSILEERWIAAVMDAVRETFSVREGAEITIEANPGTVTDGKLTVYRQSGVNRISLGLQSADDVELRRLGRIHTYADFLKSYQRVRMAGFTNVNVDLMSALPGQTLESWKTTLKKVAMLKPEHISAYSLIVEEGTPYYARFGEPGGDRGARAEDLGDGSSDPGAGQDGPAGCGSEEQTGLLDLPDLPDEDTERKMYELTQSFLGELGYERYEISNYARPGYECRHNAGYWTGAEYLGVGLGASSYVGGCRFHNEACLENYIKADFDVSPDFEEMLRQEPDMLTTQEKMEEFMFLGLRLARGVSHQEFAARFGQNLQEVYGKIIQKLRADGLLELSGDYLRLTKRGVDISNYVMSQFLFDR